MSTKQDKDKQNKPEQGQAGQVVQGAPEPAAKTQPLNLYQKLVEVRKSVPYLVRDAKNNVGKYVSATAALDGVRGKMDELGLVLVPAVTNQNVQQINAMERDPEALYLLTTLTMTMTWINADDQSETLSCAWAGQGTAKNEWGIGKAITYATKYFLLAFFQVPTPKDDPDAAAGSNCQDTTAAGTQQQPAQTNPARQHKKAQPEAWPPPPDITQKNWADTPLNLGWTGDCTARDLAGDARLPRGDYGRSFLARMTEWKERPDWAEFAALALQLTPAPEQAKTE